LIEVTRKRLGLDREEHHNGQPNEHQRWEEEARRKENQRREDEERERQYTQRVENLRTAQKIQSMEEEDRLKPRPEDTVISWEPVRSAPNPESVSGEQTEDRSGQRLGDPSEGLSSGAIRVPSGEVGRPSRIRHRSQEYQMPETGTRPEAEGPSGGAPTSKEKPLPPSPSGGNGRCLIM